MKQPWKMLAIIGILSLGACSSMASVQTTPIQERPVPPPVPEKIMGKGMVPATEMALFLRKNNPKIASQEAMMMATLYHDEARAESVNADIAFVQMCLETSFLRFGGLVTPDMHNYCGLGSIGPEKPGERFESAQLGVRAHIQHLKAYGSIEDLRQSLVDPRFKYVKRGSAPTIFDLAGRWASDKEYGNKLSSLLNRLYQSAFGTATQSPR